MSSGPRVHYVDLRPAEFRERMQRCPVGYLPLGTLEWHGEHAPLGTDAIIPQGLFEQVAQKYGGIVFPPLFLGPDRIQAQPDGSSLLGMDYDATTTPARQLDGNCYWVSEGFFLQMCEAVLIQAKRAGFQCIMADGHGPSRKAWARACAGWEEQLGIRLLSVVRDFPMGWTSQLDHAARNETSLVAALRPNLVDLGCLPADRRQPAQGVIGEDPRDSSAVYGNECLAQCVLLVGDKLRTLGLGELAESGPRPPAIL